MTNPREPQQRDESGRQPDASTSKRDWVTRREAVDAYFDGIVPRRSTVVRDALRENPGEQHRIEHTERILDQLNAPIQTPDLTLAILDDVHQLRPFRTVARPRWRVVAGWASMAAAVVVAVGGYVMLQSLAPRRALPSTPHAGTIARDSSRSPAVVSELDTPAMRAARPTRGALEMGPVAANTQTRKWEASLDKTALAEVAPRELAARLAADLGLRMKPNLWTKVGEHANLSLRREMYPVPPSLWLRRPVRTAPLFDLSSAADPAASAWFAPTHGLAIDAPSASPPK